MYPLHMDVFHTRTCSFTSKYQKAVSDCTLAGPQISVQLRVASNQGGFRFVWWLKMPPAVNTPGKDAAIHRCAT